MGWLAHQDNVFIGPNVTFTNDFTPRSKQRPSEFLKITVKHHACIGANATIIGGITIGEYAMVGAGSVVTKDVPSYALVYGNPAKQHGWVNEAGNKVQDKPNQGDDMQRNELTEQNRTAVNDDNYAVPQRGAT